MTIAIDFDGVIHKYSKGWHNKTVYDEPVDGAFDAIERLKNKGYTVYIHTARDPKEVYEWLKKWAPDWFLAIDVTNEKRPALAYIDDRAIRFTNWSDMLNYF